MTSRRRSQNSGLLIVAILVIAAGGPYFLGAWLAVHFGADNPSTTRTLVAWLFEVPWLIVLAVFGLRAYRKHVAYQAAVAEYNAPRAVAGPGGSTVYHHGGCTINHKTAESATKCTKG